MADPGRLTPADYDPWRVATPLQLLQLMHRLGRSSREIARALGVTEAAISQWSRAKRSIPPRYAAPLRDEARLALNEVAERTDKAAALAPSEDVRQAIRAEFGTLWQRWKLEVLHDAGTLRRGLGQNRETFETYLAHRPFWVDDLETLDLIWGTMRQQVALLMELEGVVDPEQALLDRLTQAHVAAQQRRDPAQDPGPQTTNPPDPET